MYGIHCTVTGYVYANVAKLPACLAICLEVFACCLLIGNLGSATIKPCKFISLYLKDRFMKKWEIISNK